MYRVVCDASHFSYVRRATHVLSKLDLLGQPEGLSATKEITH